MRNTTILDNKKQLRVERWLRKIKDRPGTVIIGGSVNGLSFARSLGRKGVPTILLESECLIGTYTRFGDVVILPAVDEFPEEWINLLEFISDRAKVKTVLFPTSDEHSLFISQHADILKKSFRFLVPDIGTIKKILNKREQYSVASNAGIPIPKTYFPDTIEQVETLSQNISYPCILKPHTSHIGRKKIKGKVLISNTPVELVSEYSRVSTPGSEFMVQEIIPGGDESLFGYLALWDGEELDHAWLTKQKLRQSNAFGDGSLQITVDAGEVANMSRKLLQEFHYRGFVGIEFRFDSRNNTYRLIEINPRTVSGNQLAISAGIDFPWIGYHYLTGADFPGRETKPFRPGVKYINEELDLKAFLNLRKDGKLSFGQWLQSVRGAKAWAVGAWDDPFPFLVMIGRLLRAFFRDLLKGTQ